MLTRVLSITCDDNLGLASYLMSPMRCPEHVTPHSSPRPDDAWRNVPMILRRLGWFVAVVAGASCAPGPSAPGTVATRTAHHETKAQPSVIEVTATATVEHLLRAMRGWAHEHALEGECWFVVETDAPDAASLTLRAGNTTTRGSFGCGKAINDVMDDRDVLIRRRWIAGPMIHDGPEWPATTATVLHLGPFGGTGSDQPSVGEVGEPQSDIAEAALAGLNSTFRSHPDHLQVIFINVDA